MVGPAGSPTCTVYADVTLTLSKVKVKVTGLLNFRQLAKPCMLAAMTAAPLRGFLVYASYLFLLLSLTLQNIDPLRFQAGGRRRRPNLVMLSSI